MSAAYCEGSDESKGMHFLSLKRPSQKLANAKDREMVSRMKNLMNQVCTFQIADFYIPLCSLAERLPYSKAIVDHTYSLSRSYSG
jgi:hypothetical protein